MKEYRFIINGKEYNVAVNGIENGVADVTVNGKGFNVELDSSSRAAETSVRGAAPDTETAIRRIISSPLPGVVIEVSVKEGQAVRKGQKVAVIEAMKMENDILAESDGTVEGIRVTKGDSVLEGAEIMTIA